MCAAVLMTLAAPKKSIILRRMFHSRDGVPGGLSSEDLIFLARCARFLRYVHPVWQV